MDLNNVSVVGRLTADPEVHHLENDNAVGNGRMATNRVYYKGEEKVEETTYITFKVWGSIAKVLEKYCHSGSEIGISGRLFMDEWEDKESKEKRQRLLNVFRLR